MADDQPAKKPAAPRAETMQSKEVDARQQYYLPDYNRSVLANSAEEAVEIAKKEADKVTKDQDNG